MLIYFQKIQKKHDFHRSNRIINTICFSLILRPPTDCTICTKSPKCCWCCSRGASSWPARRSCATPGPTSCTWLRPPPVCFPLRRRRSAAPNHPPEARARRRRSFVVLVAYSKPIIMTGPGTSGLLWAYHSTVANQHTHTNTRIDLWTLLYTSVNA